MSTRVSSATNLSATYFMRNFYSNNRDAMKSSKRKEYSITELAYDDSTALHRAANKDGTLKANEELVKKADADTLNSLFGNDNDFTSSLYRVSRQMSSSSYDDYYTSLRTGSNINLTV